MKNSMNKSCMSTLLAGLLMASACVLYAAHANYAMAADDGGGGGGGGGGKGGGGESGGGHGGSESGGGHGGSESGGGHGGGKGGKGEGEGGGHGGGGLKLRHGLSADHQGHASGVHGHEKGISEMNSPGPSQRFGGGSGIAGADQILEGPGENAPGGNGEVSSHRNQFRNQFRYWGGWTLPGEGDSGGTDGTDGIGSTDPGFNSGGGGGAGTAFHLVGESRCGDMGSLNAGTRLDGKNLMRFREARSLLAPNEKLPASAILLLANYQVELEKKEPDPVLAGTYIGNVAKQPVTPELISKVSDGLCVIPPEDKKGEIAKVAEEQRLSIMEKSSQNADH